MDIIVGFGSLVIIPFLGVLNLFKVRAFPYLATFVAIWFVLGVMAIGGGVTPMGKGDIVAPEEREAWFALPAVRFILKLWLAGLALGVPLLVITWFYEKTKTVSAILRAIKTISTLAAFGGAVYGFITVVIVPRFFA